jgi:transcriptional regulator with GAF, ATPase, and Fis domain
LITGNNSQQNEKSSKAKGWRVSGKDGAAEILGLNPKTLESMMKQLGIQRNKKNT